MRSDLHFRAHTLAGLGAGPRLIVTGAVHGNETCGTEAIRRVLHEIDAGRLRIRGGQVTFVPVTNPLAYAKGDRVGDRNLNRNLTPVAAPRDFEDHIANWLCPLLGQHDVLLDLHSTRASNPPFAMLGPEDNTGALQPFRHFAAERALAARLGVSRFVEGWLATYADGVRARRARALSGATVPNPLNTDPRYGVGTTEYMRQMGGYAITLECGGHNDAEAPEVAYRAIRNTLAWLAISDEPAPPAVEGEETLLLYAVVDREHAGDQFTRTWKSFDPLLKGELVGLRADGMRVEAPASGYIVFPDAAALPGTEWFYLARPRGARITQTLSAQVASHPRG